MPRNIFNLLLSFGACSGPEFVAVVDETSVEAILGAVEWAGEGARAGEPEEVEAIISENTPEGSPHGKNRKRTKEKDGVLDVLVDEAGVPRNCNG